MRRQLSEIQKAIAKAKRTALEDQFLASCRVLGLPEPVREYRFCERRWRFDFFWEIREGTQPLRRVAVEIMGGIHIRGNRSHSGKIGYEEDCRKANTAAMFDIRLLRFTGDMVKSLEAAQVTKEALGL